MARRTCDPCPVSQPIGRTGSVLSLVLVGLATAAPPAAAVSAGAFRTATLTRSSGPGLQHKVFIRTHDVPRHQHARMFARANGIRAHARRIPGTARWEVSRHTGNGRALVRTLREDLEGDGTARLRAKVRLPCGSSFRARFSITDYNDPAPARAERAAACL
jgi:hypothetical protein